MKRIGVFGGGGSFGAFIVGVMLQLLSGGVTLVQNFFTHLVGTSTGALEAVALGYGGVLRCVAIWRGIKSTQDIYVSKDDLGIPFNELADLIFGEWDGELNDAPLFKLIQSIVVGAPTVPVTVCFTDYEDGQTYFATALTDGTFTLEDDVKIESYPASWLPKFQLCVLASASTPALVNGVKIDDKMGCFDGGVSDLVPTDYGIKLAGATGEIICISLTDPIKPYSGVRSIQGTLTRSVEILVYSQFKQSMGRLKAAQSSTLNVVIYQKPDLGGDAAQFVPATIEEYITAGQNAKPDFGQLSA